MHGNFRGLLTGVRFAEFAFGIRGCGVIVGTAMLGLESVIFLSIRVWLLRHVSAMTGLKTED